MEISPIGLPVADLVGDDRGADHVAAGGREAGELAAAEEEGLVVLAGLEVDVHGGRAAELLVVEQGDERLGLVVGGKHPGDGANLLSRSHLLGEHPHLGEHRGKLVAGEVHFLELLVAAPVLVLLGDAKLGRQTPAAVIVSARTHHPELVQHVVRLKERMSLALGWLRFRFFVLRRGKPAEQQQCGANGEKADCQAFGCLEMAVVALHGGSAPFARGWPAGKEFLWREPVLIRLTGG